MAGAKLHPVLKEPAADIPELAALKALSRGEASEDQQRRALKFIVDKICDFNGASFDPESERVTAFAEGKRHVAKIIMNFIHKPIERK